ncbi:WD repeat-containing protein 11 isoform X1 [Lingula anatina]|uniref:WD repeat-containing protein 11 isoform X1 n=1 Tax=Lingula anatina TaxID=7574 RepID=A0A1S3H9F4_LINAN|nr:WD repeat-containing protein 11 isoform X1 [Lingula anatina]|eukprot:XP_013381759.1 WD repeat-containing protein 11 isoform X1 [Lingula anatina]
MRVPSRILSGALHHQNKGACDWGWQGLLAYGCQNLVVVIDTQNLQILQTLEKHRGNVVKVKWGKENYFHDVVTGYPLRLASADTNGRIVIWSISTGTSKIDFADGNKPVQDMEWLSYQDHAHDLLVTLCPPYSLVLWRADTGQKLWKKTYTETLTSFSFDPFDSKNVAFLGQDCIVFIDDFSVVKVPSSNGKKFFVSSPSSQLPAVQAPVAVNGEKKSSKITLKRMSQLLQGEKKEKNVLYHLRTVPLEEVNVTLNECLQLTYHQTCRHHIILLYAREVLILDLEINQTVGIIPIDRTGSSFAQIIPCSQRDVLLGLHDNGSITVRVRHKGAAVAATPEQVGTYGTQEENGIGVSQPDMIYDLRCQSDPMRLTKHARVYGMVCSPVTERNISLIMSDGRVLVWDLMAVDSEDSLSGNSPMYTPGHSKVQKFMFSAFECQLPLVSNAPFPKSTLNDYIGNTQVCSPDSLASKSRHGIVFKFVLTGMMSGLGPAPLVIKMCPPLTTKNFSTYKPLLAVGTPNGTVQVFNVSSGEQYREYSVHSSAVKGIDWVSLTAFLSFAHSGISSSSQVKNELVLVNVQSGTVTQVRQNREEESPIELIAVSPLRQYFVVVFKDKPFELWDLRTLSIIREMPRNFPRTTALCWAPSHSTKTLKKRQTNEGVTTLSVTDLTTSAPAAISTETTTNSDKPGSSQTTAGHSREHFVFTDADGLLYHFIVEGSIIKDGSKIPPENGMGSITSLAWKSDTMVMGDVDGNLNIWDLRARLSKAIPTHRGWIRKVKFAPGRGNQKLLVMYNDGADIWDTKDLEQVSSLKCPKELPRINDIDWAASDKPVLATADGCIRVADLDLKGAMATLEEYHLTAPIFCPHLLPSKAALTLKYLLQHQPWQEYKLELGQHINNEVQHLVNMQFKILDNDLKAYLTSCSFGTAERCLLTARIFGDESDLHFWTVALHYLRAEKVQPLGKLLQKQLSSSSGSGDLYKPGSSSCDLVQLDDDQSEVDKTQAWRMIQDQPLETCYDVLCDNQTFQKYQLDRIALHDVKRESYEHTKKVAENLMLLGQTDRAVQLLLETEAENDSYYIDCLRACLVASIRSSGASQSTIKLVATNLIANGKLSEGVQLLCLIDKGLDACRYLQTYGEWNQAAWLAKATLNASESLEVMKRYSEHLCSAAVNHKSQAVLVMLSLRQFVKVLEMLYGQQQFDRAALFLEACLEFGIIQKTKENSSLLEAVFLEYARFLTAMQNTEAAHYYCHLAGGKGQQFMKELQDTQEVEVAQEVDVAQEVQK